MIKKGHPILTVRFKDSVPLGKGMDPKSFLDHQSRVLSVPVHITFFDETFFQVEFKGLTKTDKYFQLIPWSNVAAVLFEPEKH